MYDRIQIWEFCLFYNSLRAAGSQLQDLRGQEERQRVLGQRPMLCRKSLEIAEHLENFGPRRSTTRAKSHANQDEQTANPSSTTSVRSLHDLSVGEQERRQAKREAAAKKKSEDEMEGLTFRPSVNQRRQKKKAEEVGGNRISITKDPQRFMQMLKEKQAEKSRKIDEAQRGKEAQELAACTFQPKKGTVLPSYHTRRTREAQAKRTAPRQPDKVAPEWR